VTPAKQVSEAGQVTVGVTWQGHSAGPVFAVTLDTQAVDLDGYDLRGLTALRTDQGRELQPTSRELRIAGGVLAFGSPRSEQLVLRVFFTTSGRSAMR